MRALLLSLSVCLGFASTARGHATGSSSLQIDVGDEAVTAELRAELRDLDAILVLDEDGDRLASPSEVAARSPAIHDYASSRIELRTDGRRCTLGTATTTLVGSTAVTRFAAHCHPPFERITVRDDLFFEHDISHRAFVRVNAEGATHHFIATNEKREVSVERASPSWGASFSRYLREGVWHIASGFDHLLFLLTLLFPAVLARTRPSTEVAPGLRGGAVRVLKIVTAFTLAHSLTLSLAALELVALPSRFVESAIAASIVAAAVINLLPNPHLGGASLAFGFGLLHGFGFAGVLSELGLPAGRAVPALLGFNLGVELGQLAIVLAMFPLLYCLRSSALYRRYVLRWGSLLVIVVACLWFVERAFELMLVEPLLAVLERADLRHPLASIGAAAWLVAVLALVLARRTHRHRFTLAARGLGVAGAIAALSGVLVSAASAQRARSRSIELADDERRAGVRAQRNRDAQAATRHLTRASELFGAAGDAASSTDMLMRIGDVALARGDLPVAKSTYERALSMREQQSDARGVASACHQLTWVSRLEGDLTRASGWLRRAVEIEEELGLELLARRDHVELASIYRETKQFEAAVHALGRAIAIDEALERQGELAQDLTKLAVVLQLRGELAEAERVYLRAIELHRALGNRIEHAKAAANVATIARLQGDEAQAAAGYREALEMFEREGDPQQAARVRALLARDDARTRRSAVVAQER